MTETTDPQQAARDRLFALIASIPGSGGVDWCGKARALLNEIAAAPAAAPSVPVDRAALRDRIAAVIHDDLTSHKGRRDLGLLGIVPRLAAAVLAVIPEAADRAAEWRAAADHLETLDPIEAALAGQHAWREAAETLRRAADEAQQPTVVTTVEKAAARGMTDTEYRAASHQAAVEAVRAAAKGMYAEVGLRVMDALSEAQQPETQADGWHLTPQTLDLFVRALVNEVDYDIHKNYERGEEDGEDHYPELVTEAAEMLNAITNQQSTAEAQQPKEADGSRTVCVCGHTRAEHLVVGGRLLCDECDPDSTNNLVCKEFEAL